MLLPQHNFWGEMVGTNMNGEKNKKMSIVKRIAMSLIMPVAIFVVFFAISVVRDVPYGTTAIFWQILLERIIASVCIAYALAVQIKNGRFDFSGGALMTVVGIAAGHLCKTLELNAWVLLLLCIAFSVIASIVIALVYIYGKLPITICTIGMALVLESVTCLINKGNGVSIATNAAMSMFGVMPWELLVLGLSAIIYFVYNTYTVSGRKAELLANNQSAAVDIGINENKNVLQTFIVSGVLYGFAAVILVSRASPALASVASTLTTVGTAFSALMPVFMGFFIGKFSNDTIGIFLATFAMECLNYGIEVNTPASIRAAYTNICTGVFMVIFFLCTQQGKQFVKLLKTGLTKRHG